MRIKPEIIRTLREWAEFEQDGGNVEQGAAIDTILDWYDRQVDSEANIQRLQTTVETQSAALEAYKYSPHVHPDDLAVDRFAAAMKIKLAQKRAEGRGGWDDKEDCSADFLSTLLREHVEKGDPLDVGNLAMMLHQRGERIASPVSKRVERLETLKECAKIAHTAHLQCVDERDRIRQNTPEFGYAQAKVEAVTAVWHRINELLPKEPSSAQALQGGRS